MKKRDMTQYKKLLRRLINMSGIKRQVLANILDVSPYTLSRSLRTTSGYYSEKMDEKIRFIFSIDENGEYEHNNEKKDKQIVTIYSNLAKVVYKKYCEMEVI